MIESSDIVRVESTDFGRMEVDSECANFAFAAFPSPYIGKMTVLACYKPTHKLGLDFFYLGAKSFDLAKF